MSAHRPVTTCFAGHRETTIVYFYCPCGVSRRLVAVGTDIHPVERFTAAIRRLHEVGVWPPAEVDLGDAEDAGWGPDPEAVEA